MGKLTIKVWENNDLMMYFKKRHCRCCGNPLQRKRTENLLLVGTPEHRAYLFNKPRSSGNYDILLIGTDYYCPCCDKMFSCAEQIEIIAAQKYYKTKTVSEEQVRFARENKILCAKKRIRDFRWFLFIPVVGLILCYFYITQGPLTKTITHKENSWLMLLTPVVFFAVAYIMKLMLSTYFAGTLSFDLLRLIMIIPAIFAMNLPILWYINHKFK